MLQRVGIGFPLLHEPALRKYATKSGPSQLMQRVKPTVMRVVKNVAKRMCPKWDAIVTGSQCQGTAVERSDLDILIQNRGSGRDATRQDRQRLAKDCTQALQVELQQEGVQIRQQGYEKADKLTLTWPGGQKLSVDLVFAITTHGLLPARGDENKFQRYPDVTNAVKLFKKFLVLRHALPFVSGYKIEALAILCADWVKSNAPGPVNGIHVFYIMLWTLWMAGMSAQHLSELESRIKAYLPPQPYLTMGAAKALGQASHALLKEAWVVRHHISPADVTNLLAGNTKVSTKHLAPPLTHHKLLSLPPPHHTLHPSVITTSTRKAPAGMAAAGGNPYPCPRCRRSFDTVQGLQDHRQVCHSGVGCGKRSTVAVVVRPQSVNPHPCPGCGCSFKTRQGLQDHLQFAHKMRGAQRG